MARGQNRSNRGGNQPPRRPAPVSGPGALSARTDGGPGNPRQPIRVAAGGPHGQRQALEDQQRAAPLPAAPRSLPGATTSPPPAPGAGAFGPTDRPAESPLAGVSGIDPEGFVADPDLLLRVLYARMPVFEIGRLIRDL